MNYHTYIYTLLSILACTLHVKGQSWDTLSTLRHKEVIVKSTTIATDTLPIIASSIRLTTENGQQIEAQVVLQNTNILINNQIHNALKGKKIQLSYRVFPLSISKNYFNLDSAILAEDIRYRAYDPNKKISTSPNLLASDELDYSGSFSRGFSVGNAQSLVLNSNFNLQLAGEIGNGIKIAAAISDDNIPIQPEGSTQLLREFDRVYIKVSKDKTSVIAGDYPLQKPKGYFTKYFKKVQGLGIHNSVKIKNTTLSSDASIAVSKGKFARQNLSISEGNQGPYKLEGNNGERFLIVLSGTEKVYIDGELMKRGLDYIIDYNRAEISFTPQRLIKREYNIIIEFEYTDQNYLRTLYTANTYANGKNWNVNLNFYSEQDSKTATNTLTLDSMDFSILSMSGDNIAARSGIRTLPDTNTLFNRVTYTVLPFSTPDDTITQIVAYSTDKNLDLVQVTFSEVGQNMGRYAIDNTSRVNGRVYKYVGLGNGSYEPIIRLIPPEQKQVLSLGGSYALGEGISLSGEISLSQYDKNRLSVIDNNNNNGLATMLRYNHVQPLSKKWKIRGNATYERLSKDYNQLNPYQNTEFNNDWNISAARNGTEHLLTTSIGFIQSDSLRLTYGYNLLDIAKTYKGKKHDLSGEWRSAFGTQLSLNASTLSSESLEENTDYKRLISTLSQSINKSHEIGVYYEYENNQRTSLANSILTSLSNAYDLSRLFLNGSLSDRLDYSVKIDLRNDYLPAATDLIKAINTKEINANLNYSITSRHNVTSTFGYRDSKILVDSLLAGQSSKKTLIGSLEHSIGMLNGGIASNLTYTMNSGQQPKVEYFFEQVQSGQGDYIYIGNEDSTLTNANFRYAPQLNTGNYIRLSLVNGEFELTNNQRVNYNLRISPERFLRKRKQVVYNLLNRLSTISTIRIDKKIAASDGIGFLNFSRSDTSIVQYNAIIHNTLFINKNRRQFDIQLSHRSISSVFTQISGLERRGETSYNAKLRVKLFRNTDFLFSSTIGNRTYDAQLFEARAYDIRFRSLAPKLSFRPNSQFRINIEYAYDKRNQRLNNLESSSSNTLASEITYRQSSSLFTSASLDYTAVQFNGKSESLIEFDLLRGLKNGKNFLWKFNLTKRLNKSIDLSVTYEGRKNGLSPIVHTARAQAKATF